MTVTETPIVGDTVCVGEILAEWIFHSPHEVPKNRTVIVKNVRRELGGAALNVHSYLTQLGRASRLVAPIGQGDLEAVQASLAPYEFGDATLLPVPGDTDTLFTVATKESHRSVYFFSSWPSGTGELLLQACSVEGSLILNGGRHPAIRDAYRVLASGHAATFLAFNPSYAIFEYSRDELAPIFKQAHLTVLNAQEFDFLESSIGKLSSKRLGTDPMQIVAVTRGRNGVSVLSAQGFFELPSLTSSDRIAIGAGDAFFAGYLHHFMGGATVRESTRYGLALAAIVVDSNQIRVAITEKDVQQRLV